MKIRLLSPAEIPMAVVTMTEIYTTTMMQYAKTAEEIEKFKSDTDENYLRGQIASGKLFLWGAFDGDRLCGVTTLDEYGAVGELYMRPEYQDGNCERELLEAIYMFRHQRKPQRGKSLRWLSFGIITFCCLFILIISLLMGDVSEDVVTEESDTFYVPEGVVEEYEGQRFPDTFDYDKRQEEVVEVELPNNTGVNFAIPQEEMYVGENLEYELVMETIEMEDDTEEKYMEFDIRYPQLIYADGRDASAVNQVIRDCACRWYDIMYPEPQMDKLVYLEDLERLYLVTRVKYQVTYMSNDLICVVFQNGYFPGNIGGESYDFHTRVINLHTGECYTIEKLITADSALGQLYYDKLVAKEHDFKELKGLSKEIVEQTLSGETVEGRYYSNFYVSNKGVSFALTLHHGTNGLIWRGWQNVEFSEEELLGYRTDSTFWQIIE